MPQLSFAEINRRYAQTEIPQGLVIATVTDYLRYRYRLEEGDFTITQDDAGGVVIFTRFQTDTPKKEIFVEIEITLQPRLLLVPHEPSPDHPEHWKFEGVRMVTREERHEDMEIGRTIKEIPYAARYSLAHLPSVMPKKDTLLTQVKT